MSKIRELALVLIKIVALVVILYTTSLLGLRSAGYEFAVVLSGSMAPTIERGDLVILREINPSDLTVNEIIQYRRGNLNILHRIKQIKPKGFRTKGDANKGADPVLVKPSQVSQLAVGSLKGYGMPLLLLKSLIDTTNSEFTDTHLQPAKSRSAIWINPVAKWKTISGGGTFTFTSPNGVSSSGNGNRAIFLNKNIASNDTFYSSFKLTNKDLSSTMVYFNASVCIPSTAITCGWSIGINQTNGFLTIQTYSTSGARQSPLFSKSFTMDLTNQVSVAITANSQTLQMSINGEQIFNLEEPLALAMAKGLNVPNGGYFGFATTNSNQFRSFQTMTW